MDNAEKRKEERTEETKGKKRIGDVREREKKEKVKNKSTCSFSGVRGKKNEKQ